MGGSSPKPVEVILDSYERNQYKIWVSDDFSVSNRVLSLYVAHFIVAKTECMGWLWKYTVRLREVYGWLTGSIWSGYSFVRLGYGFCMGGL